MDLLKPFRGIDMKDFTAIDFETANSSPSSVCSVGLVAVRDGKIVETAYRLIRPRPDYYLYHNTLVHGMTAGDTCESPEFPDVWAELEELVDGVPLVAHWSQFDQACLRAAHNSFEMQYPDYEFHCTCRGARRAFPNLPNHKLPTVAAHIGYRFENHHHALADAQACAEIALSIFCD